MAASGILAESDLEAFAANGYLVVRNVVSRELTDAVVEVIFDFLGMDPASPADWYRPPLATNGMVELYQHQALWNVRQHPRIYQAFAEILGKSALWVSIDRVSLKPPAIAAHPEYDRPGFIHLDGDPPEPDGSPRVQGLVALTDTTADQGGFQCVPELYRRPDELALRYPGLRGRPEVMLAGAETVSVPVCAGDLIIWSQLLPHGSDRNTSNRPRLAQYLTMFPARSDARLRQRRIDTWRYRLAPSDPHLPGDPRRIEQLYYDTASLTPLGRRLLGLDCGEPEHSVGTSIGSARCATVRA